MPIKLIPTGERFELVLRTKPRGTRCMVNACSNTKPKRGHICSRCLMLRWRANNPEYASFQHLKESATRRGIKFKLTFDDFRAWGHSTGYFSGKGRQKDGLTVDRIDQGGAYEIGNIQVLTNKENARKERLALAPRRERGPQHPKSMNQNTNTDNRAGAVAPAATCSALAEQRNALAEARLRIIARQEQVKKWSRKDTTDLMNANWDGISEGLAQARRIIGAMWFELPVPQPQAVIDHEAHMRRVIEGQNAALSGPRGGEGAPNQQQPANRPDGSLQ